MRERIKIDFEVNTHFIFLLKFWMLKWPLQVLQRTYTSLAHQLNPLNMFYASISSEKLKYIPPFEAGASILKLQL